MDLFFADLILLFHFSYVLFVVLGLIVIWIGYFLKWNFVHNFWFRLAHLAAIGYVVAESFMGVICPLTVWENEFRLKAGGGQFYQGSFIQHWIHMVMYYDGSPMIFTVIYSIFFTAVLMSFWFVIPQKPHFGK